MRFIIRKHILIIYYITRKYIILLCTFYYKEIHPNGNSIITQNLSNIISNSNNH